MKIKNIIRLLLLIFLGFAVSRFCQKQTDGFSIVGISSDRPHNPAWDTRELTTEESQNLNEALNQRYSYFGCGGQSFIFFSEDDKYAIKLFKQRVFTVPFWLRHFPIPYILDRYRAKKTWIREDKIQRDFGSYKIAFEDLNEFSGLIYIHLNKTNDLKKKLTIIDRLKIAHTIDLDQFDFIIQKKGELVHERIARAMSQGETEVAKQLIKNVFHMIHTRCQMGYHDRDPNIRTNSGFLGEKPIKIDLGRFVYNHKMRCPEVYTKEFKRITDPFGAWISEKYPTLSQFFKEEQERSLSAVAN